ncbi:LLM class flavin-dependent oxidoreductase [Pseudonocardia humida]|uniref:LLM class flavin-dependent oxidoreductase n=1 Tax=Pseudonocardia humida TaxID=2800819 RepID=A0ABT1A5M4_9PSEU|nr:LLM class flavin-dependent oxidoreductase [Pseudonocardia humida]MCO1658313.1 LLM class flavin-dependent oxidoreductase [Pseudonocardia humida]
MSSPTTGVVFRPQCPPEQLRDAVRAAEDAGVAELWLWEDCFFEGSMSAAAAALAWSDRLAVGIGLVPVPLRNAALTAMELATVARMFPGRFLPGLGHGVLDWMAQVGARAASPMTLLREQTTAIRALLGGETVTTSGKHVQLDAVALDWPPPQPPPLLVGGRGPKTLRLAGELADGVILDVDQTPEGVRRQLASVQQGREAAGRADGPFRAVVYVEADPTATDLSAQMARRAAELGGVGATSVVFQPPGVAPDPRPLIEALMRS